MHKLWMLFAPFVNDPDVLFVGDIASLWVYIFRLWLSVVLGSMTKNLYCGIFQNRTVSRYMTFIFFMRILVLTTTCNDLETNC